MQIEIEKYKKTKQKLQNRYIGNKINEYKKKE